MLCKRFAPLLAMGLIAGSMPGARALIMGGEGNAPIQDPGWPAGAATIFNTSSRIAWWEGPPLGGGEWHAECRGDAKALSAVLTAFAKLEVKAKRIVLHNGIGRSFWLSATRAPDRSSAARMDWSFTVWQPASWQQQANLPPGTSAIDRTEAREGPPARIDVYTGGDVKWDRVARPKGVQIEDLRLEAHGFTVADGTVLEGNVTDLGTGKPLAARVRVERADPHAPQGDNYATVVETVAARDGHWRLTRVPEGWQRVVVAAPGYVPRVIGYAEAADQPGWHAYNGGLARPGRIEGRVLDDMGRPLEGVDVRIQDVLANPGEGYESPLGYSVQTGRDGRFHADQVPVGRAAIWVWKRGYCRPGLGPQVSVPQRDLVLTMRAAAQVEVTVDFAGKDRPGGYIVQIQPEGGEIVGSYGGSGQINVRNQMVFKDVPPGRFVFSGQPNPGSASEKTAPVLVDLKGGETTRITLTAK